jgi:ATP-dependent RNA helicase DHX29
LNVNADDGAMVNAALAAGLYPKLLVVDLSTGGLKTLTNNQAISVVSRIA